MGTGLNGPGPEPAVGRIDPGKPAIVAGFRFLEHCEDRAARDFRFGTSAAGPTRPIGDIRAELNCQS
jgi:hypothetical protein